MAVLVCSEAAELIVGTFALPTRDVRAAAELEAVWRPHNSQAVALQGSRAVARLAHWASERSGAVEPVRSAEARDESALYPLSEMVLSCVAVSGLREVGHLSARNRWASCAVSILRWRSDVQYH